MVLVLLAFRLQIEFFVAVQGSWGLAERPGYLSALAWTGEQDGTMALGGLQANWSKVKLLPQL